jgi:hypothetical protein
VSRRFTIDTNTVNHVPKGNSPASRAKLPLLILLVVVNLYVFFQIPRLTISIFSGSTGGHGGSMVTASTAPLLRS